MKIHRFYIPHAQEVGHTLSVEDSHIAHQWKSVFRMKKGDRVSVFNNRHIEFLCTILLLEKNRAVCEVLHKEQKTPSSREITLCAAVIKKDHFEWIVQKATELGATMIIPILSERSEKKKLNHERLEKIVIEATEQCGRVDVPSIGMPIGLENALAALSHDTHIIAFDPTGDPFSVHHLINQKITIFIGPEGGWTEKELALFRTKGIVMQLNTPILRAETAAVATLAMASAGKSEQ